MTTDGHNAAGYKAITSPGTTRSRGVAILYLPCLKVERSTHTEGRFVLSLFSFNDYTFQLVCLYAPNARDPNITFFESFYNFIDSTLPVILCGDFNSAVDPALDRAGGNPTSYWSNNWSAPHHLLMDTFDLKDVWRWSHPTDREYTWHRRDGSIKSRIDMIWIPNSLLKSLSFVEILPFFRSDHHYVYLHLSLEAVRGKGLWKLNNTHLSDPVYRDRVTSFWQQWQRRETDFLSQPAWWDASKARIKKLTAAFAKEKSAQISSRISSLNNAIKQIQARSWR